MRLGLVTYNVAKDWDVPTIISMLEKARFEAVELRSTHAHGVEPGISASQIEDVRNRFAASSVRLLSLGSACEFHSPDEAVRRKNVEEAGAFLELAHDLGCWGVKVRPNGLPEGVPEEVTIGRIGEALAACGAIGEGLGVEVWVEVHGRQTQEPRRIRAMMDACGHPNVGVCWNCNPTDVQNGTIRDNFKLLQDFIRNVHIHDLYEDYPYKELFGLLRGIGYERYLLFEGPASAEPERFLAYYQALFQEMVRA
ncbi:MAG: sugar phosphate isomerase/epimerase family protein [Bryobacterales bacterium]